MTVPFYLAVLGHPVYPSLIVFLPGHPTHPSLVDLSSLFILLSPSLSNSLITNSDLHSESLSEGKNGCHGV